jgi:OmpA-OmpF porin, OOP family
MRQAGKMLLCAAMSATPCAPAAAQAVSGPYVGVAGGWNGLVDLHAHASEPALDQPRTNDRFEPGFVGASDAGWGFGNGLRAEIEGAYDYNAINNRAGTARPERTTGNQGTYGVFANAFYDIDLHKLGLHIDAFQPYVGAGAGALWTHFAPITSVADGGNVFRMGGTGANFAYQAVVGVGFPIRQVPGLKFAVDYRFIGIDVRSGAVGTLYSSAGIGTGTVHLSPAFLHQVAFGISYAFNAAPKPPAPAPAAVEAPAPVAARSYLVFFDWDASALSPRALQIVAEAAANSTRVATTTVTVDGYADTSHALPGRRGQDYNLRLSLRRAASVRAELVRDGVPAGAIAIHGYGDTHLLVPTGPDAREPQNRRVEIVLR